MSLTDVTFSESCTERERIKIMLKELQEDEVQKLSESSAGGTYVSTKKLLDLSIDDDIDKECGVDIFITTTTPVVRDVQTNQVPTMVSTSQRANHQTKTDEVYRDPLRDELKSIREDLYDEDQYDEELHDEELHDEELHEEELHEEGAAEDQFELVEISIDDVNQEPLSEYMSEADSADAYARANICLAAGDIESGVKLLEEIGLKSYNITYTVIACLELMSLDQKNICSYLDQVILKENNICERLNVKSKEWGSHPNM